MYFLFLAYVNTAKEVHLGIKIKIKFKFKLEPFFSRLVVINPTTKSGSGSIPSNSRFCHTYPLALEYIDCNTWRPRIIWYYRKPINLPLMILYTE